MRIYIENNIYTNVWHMVSPVKAFAVITVSSSSMFQRGKVQRGQGKHSDKVTFQQRPKVSV